MNLKGDMDTRPLGSWPCLCWSEKWVEGRESGERMRLKLIIYIFEQVKERDQSYEERLE